MPAEITMMEDCASNYGVFEVQGSTGTYTVSFSGSEGPAHCTCPAFKYSGTEQTCKHIKKVWDEACFYNPQWHDANPEPAIRPKDYTYDAFTGGTCVCGGPLVAVRRAV